MDFKNEIIDSIDKMTISFKDDIKVTAEEAVKYLKAISRELDPLSPLHYNRIKICEEIDLWLPGKYTDCPGDYQMTWNKKPPRHIDICDVLIRGSKEYGDLTYWMQLLEDVYKNGTKNLDESIDEREKRIRRIIFWVTVQEDINHKNRQGRRNAYCRYAEAIYTTAEGFLHTYEELVQRVDSKKQEELVEWELSIRPEFYKWRAF